MTENTILLLASLAVIALMAILIYVANSGRTARIENIAEIRPNIRMFETSAKTGAGMAEWLAYLAESRPAR